MRWFCRSNYLKTESIIITIWGLLKLIIALYTRTEYFLYSKEFDEAYQETEQYINAIMKVDRFGEEEVNNYV